MPRAVVKGIGSYLPKKILTNKDLEKLVDTSDEWIRERTGIVERHIGAESEQTSNLAFNAAKVALRDANMQADDVDLIIVATTTPDNTFPATATRVQSMLGMKSGAAFDVQAACTGFIYALSIADSYIRSGSAKTVLVIGADMLSRIVDWQDRNTCVLFGDGAGAMVLSAENTTSRGVLSTLIYSDGDQHDILFVDGGVSSTGSSGVIKMYGREVFRQAVEKMSEATEEVLAKASLSTKNITWMVPHQANLRIMKATAKRLGVAPSKVISTVDRHGNTSAASIPLAIHTAYEDKRIIQGDILSLQAVGGGLTWGAAVISW